MQLYTTDKEDKRVVVPSKFTMDGKGQYWEYRGTFDGEDVYVPAPPWAGNINFYLFEGPNIMVEVHSKPLCDVPEMRSGGKVTDDGNLLLNDEEKKELLRTDPLAENFLRPYMMGQDFINRRPRWCLWLKGAEPADIRKCPRVLERIEGVREFRRQSKKPATQKKADTPMLFDEVVECVTDYIAVPVVSSSTRKYIPMAWISHDVIPGSHIKFIENVTLYHFGVLMSSVHMAWVRIVSGRLRMDYSYSNTLDYNCFPWPEGTGIRGQGLGVSLNPRHYDLITSSAQAILDARALYPRSSLANLYDERTMPPELRKAHKANDEAVMNAYGFVRHYEDDKFHDEDIATALLYRYKELTGCEEYSDSYPNRELWLKYYPEDEEELGDRD